MGKKTRRNEFLRSVVILKRPINYPNTPFTLKMRPARQIVGGKVSVTGARTLLGGRSGTTSIGGDCVGSPQIRQTLARPVGLVGEAPRVGWRPPAAGVIAAHTGRPAVVRDGGVEMHAWGDLAVS